jgi:hypothetical protein
LSGSPTLPIAIQRARLAAHGSADCFPVLFGKDATRLQPMAATLKIPKPNPVFFKPLPNDGFTNVKFLRNLSHAHGLIETVKFLRGWVEIATPTSLPTLDTVFYEQLSHGFRINPIH